MKPNVKEPLKTYHFRTEFPTALKPWKRSLKDTLMGGKADEFENKELKEKHRTTKQDNTKEKCRKLGQQQNYSPKKKQPTDLSN